MYESLGGLTAEELETICLELKIDVENYEGNRILLKRSIFRFLTSSVVTTAEDGGEQHFRKILQIINEFKMSHPPSTIKKELFGNATPTATRFSEAAKISNNMGEEERLQNILMKPFKISGKIGKPGQKDSLTYSSLIFQIENGLKKGYSEVNVIDGVINAISHETELRQYLEGKGELDLVSMGKILRYHYKEKDATTLFTSLSTARQGTNESSQDFVLRLMNLRQKILFVSKEESVEYHPQLVQKRFLHAVSTGLQNDNLRIALKDLLSNPRITDEELLSSLTLAVADETEHQEKFGKSVKVVAQSNAVAAAPKEPKRPNVTEELKEIKCQLHQISQLCLRSGVSSGNNNAKSHPTNQRGRDGRDANKTVPLCPDCKKDKADSCNHCFVCGALDHIKRGCRLRFQQNPKN